MTFRRLVTAIVPYSILVLPLWVILGSGIFGRSGWKFLASLPIAAVMLVALALLAMMTWGIRSRATSHRSMPRPECVLWAILIVTGVGIGFFGNGFYAFMSIGVVAGIGLFGLAFWRIVSTAKETITNISTPPPEASTPREPEDIGNLTVIEVESTSTRTASQDATDTAPQDAPKD